MKRKYKLVWRVLDGPWRERILVTVRRTGKLSLFLVRTTLHKWDSTESPKSQKHP